MTAAEKIKEIESKIAELNIRMSSAGGGGGAHNFLSATHPDTDPDSPVRGDIVRGIAGPEWQRYAIGAAGRFLRSDGVDPSWDTIQAGDLPAHAAEHEIGGGDLVDHDNLTNFVANEHIDHTAITLTAGVGLTGGGTIAANRTFNVDVGIADNKIVQIDHAAVAANDYAKFTASGLEGRGYSEVLSDLSGQALAAFDWNDQDLTSIGAIELYGNIKTDRWLLQDSNTFVGVSVCGAGNLAHTAGSEGYYNTAFGGLALKDITKGYFNTAIGYRSLYKNTTGYDMVALGADALYNNLGGSNCMAIGYAALFNNTAGYRNDAIGTVALFENTDGNFNVGIASQALKFNQSGDKNVGIGFNAGAGTGVHDKHNNVFIGYSSGAITQAVTGNICIGYQAGDNITTGNYNIIIGYDINAPSATNDYQLNIGDVLFGEIDNKNIGIDTITFGANAVNVFAIKNGTPPAAAVADEIQIYSKDSSDGAANATLALMLEQAVEVVGTFTPSHKIKVWINGTEYWLQLDAV